jgi:hypothetical protein
MRGMTFGFIVETSYGDEPRIHITDNTDENRCVTISVHEVDSLIERLREAKDDVLANAERDVTNRVER